jgi:hypothetical protein
VLTSLAFILYRQHNHADIVAQNPGLPNPEISKIAGHLWTKEQDSVKEQWKQLAEVGKAPFRSTLHVRLMLCSARRLVTPNNTLITDSSLDIDQNAATGVPLCRGNGCSARSVVASA